MRVAVTVFCIGEAYTKKFNSLWRPSQENYCKKHGYDYIVLDDYIVENPNRKYANGSTDDGNNRLLVCSQEWSSKYDYIIFMDADILVRSDAPAIHTAYDYGDKIGIVDEFSQPVPENRSERINKKMNWPATPKDYYKAVADVDIDTDKMLNTGILVLQPKKHREFLEHIYEICDGQQRTHPCATHYLQGTIGYELLTKNMCLVMSNEWNAVWANWYIYHDGQVSIEEVFKQNYFLHFAGGVGHDMVHTISHM